MPKTVPFWVSNRHVHLSAEHIGILFGHGLTKMRDLLQPHQFAAEECVMLVGPKGSIDKVRVLGPARAETQVEILVSDTFKLGIPADFRSSGDLENTPGCRIVGPAGEVILEKWVIVALRHLHMSIEESLWYGLKDGESVSVRIPGIRGGILDNVIVRAGASHSLELHIDTEEANALGAKNGDMLEIL